MRYIASVFLLLLPATAGAQFIRPTPDIAKDLLTTARKARVENPDPVDAVRAFESLFYKRYSLAAYPPCVDVPAPVKLRSCFYTPLGWYGAELMKALRTGADLAAIPLRDEVVVYLEADDDVSPPVDVILRQDDKTLPSLRTEVRSVEFESAGGVRTQRRAWLFVFSPDSFDTTKALTITSLSEKGERFSNGLSSHAMSAVR